MLMRIGLDSQAQGSLISLSRLQEGAIPKAELLTCIKVLACFTNMQPYTPSVDSISARLKPSK